MLHGGMDSVDIIKPSYSNCNVSERGTERHAGQVEFQHLPSGMHQDLLQVLILYLLRAQSLELMAFLIAVHTQL